MLPARFLVVITLGCLSLLIRPPSTAGRAQSLLVLHPASPSSVDRSWANNMFLHPSSSSQIALYSLQDALLRFYQRFKPTLNHRSSPDAREGTTPSLQKLGPFSWERSRRAGKVPLSLDLTFHLLREALEMARADQIEEQAGKNRRILDLVGK
uniref:corticoliberin-like n=1 Tax=Myxine glutinosa TaxID=7769 RepID=UPI00359008DD